MSVPAAVTSRSVLMPPTPHGTRQWQLKRKTMEYLLSLRPEKCRTRIKENLDARQVFDGTIDQRFVNGRCQILVDGELKILYYKSFGITFDIEFCEQLDDAITLYEKRLHSMGMKY